MYRILLRKYWKYSTRCAAKAAVVIRRPNLRPVACDLSVFILGFSYQLIITWDAIRLENCFQLVATVIYNFGIVYFAVIQRNQLNAIFKNIEEIPGYPEGFSHKMDVMLDIIISVVSLATVLLGFFAYKLYHTYGWSIVKSIAADLRLRRRYLTFQIYLIMLKVDVFFFLAYNIQFLIIPPFLISSEGWVAVAAMPILIVIVMLPAFYTRRESRIGALWCALAVMAYFAYKLAKAYQTVTDDTRPNLGSLTTFGAMTMLLAFTTLIIGLLCADNFGKGLRPHLQRPPRTNSLRMTQTDRVFELSGSMIGKRSGKFARERECLDEWLF
ncbi:hypothetical protein BU16DRAFT_549601 [Lophium mytilinum]|uniref:Uncharacterized protein n=1 Tax=Lophium mytilinum TaxID=390894 RepID=A0A6A6QTT2_9PEZI|nr:hypothetical protein BU16DRAFT_549601 [Lophium mytilinum]